MDIRTALNERPVIGFSVGLLILILAGAAIWSYLRGGQGSAIGKAFYSDDDGKTWFIDNDQLIPPFDHHGKQAYGAAVYRCGMGRPFVGYLEKYSDQQRALVEQSRDNAGSHDSADRTATVPPSKMYVKNPGGKDWVAGGSEQDLKAYTKVTTIICPDAGGTPTIVRTSDSDAQ